MWMPKRNKKYDTHILLGDKDTGQVNGALSIIGVVIGNEGSL